MPFVIETTVFEPVRYDKFEWCGLQSSFNQKGTAPPLEFIPDTTTLEVCDNCKQMVWGTIRHHVSYNPERTENWCKECHSRYHGNERRVKNV